MFQSRRICVSIDANDWNDWYRMGAKPLGESMVTLFADALMRHLTSKRSQPPSSLFKCCIIKKCHAPSLHIVIIHHSGYGLRQ